MVRADPTLAETYNYLGSLYFNTQQCEKAVVTLKQGLALRPHIACASAVLGSTYLAVGDLSHACAQLENAVRENPTNVRSEDLLEQTLIHKDLSAAARRHETRVAHVPRTRTHSTGSAKFTWKSLNPSS